jgi:hypothetical protein
LLWKQFSTKLTVNGQQLGMEVITVEEQGWVSVDVRGGLTSKSQALIQYELPATSDKRPAKNHQHTNTTHFMP